MTDKPALREYQIYRYNIEQKQDLTLFYWSKPILAESARQAVRITATLSTCWAKNVIRIVKVVASGEVIEVAPFDD